MQNGLHLIVYEVAKPVIIKMHCENKDVPELHCDGKCHLKKMMQIDEAENTSNTPVNIPPPELKWNSINYFIANDTPEKMGVQKNTIELLEQHQLLVSADITKDIFRPPTLFA